LVYKRNSPAIEQLSSIDRKQATIQKMHPIREMAKWLISSGKISIPEINDVYYSKVLKRNLIRLIDFGEFGFALDLCIIVRKISPFFLRRRIITILMIFTIKINKKMKIPSPRWRLLKLLLNNM